MIAYGIEFKGTEASANGNSSYGGIGMNGVVRRLCKQSRLKDALHILYVMGQRDVRPDSSTYASLLQECIDKKALLEGKRIHAYLVDTGFKPGIFLGTKLVVMYAKCGSLLDARRLFDEMPERNVVSWTAMITAYTGNGYDEEALTLYNQMQREGIQPNKFTFSGILPACANLAALEHGKKVHEDISRSGLESDIFVGSALIDMYAKCGSLEDARRVFDKMSERNVVSWTAVIGAYASHGWEEEALRLYWQMQQVGIQPNKLTFVSVLPACASMASLKDGKEVHTGIIRSGCQPDIFVGSALVDMYAKCGSIEDACSVFEEMPKRNVVSWTAMIAAYARQGNNEMALTLYYQMQQEGIQPNKFTFVGVLLACTNFAALQHGKAVHEDISRSGFESDIFVGSALIDMYAKYGCIEDARQVFDKMSNRDEVSCTAMIAAYAGHGCNEEALTLYHQMQQEGIQPSKFTFAGALAACASLAGLIHGKEVHKDIIRSAIQSDIIVESALIDMYAKCGSIKDARQVFDEMHERDVVSCTAMIAGYGQHGQIDEALKLFQKMPERDMVSWNAMIAGYVHNKQVNEAMKLFQKMPESAVVSWNAMIAGYAQDGQVDEALKLFHKMPEQNAVSWTTMIAGYAQNGHFSEALKLFRQMQLKGVKADPVTVTSILPSCAYFAALKSGKEVHGHVIRNGFQSHISVGNALVDMYAKCGTIHDAYNVFDKMPGRNMVSWTAMIVGYAKHGRGKEALQLFEQMQHCGTKPDHVTFIGVLSACSHAGLVDDGWRYFNCMSRDFHITPAVEHYCCMVDLLGRAGHLEEAQDFINKLPIKPSAAMWGSLLGACRIHSNTALGERVAERLFELDPENAAYYVLLSNIYAAAGRWDDVEKMRKLMKDRMVKKTPGCSWVEVNNKVYSFLVGDRSHPQMHKIYSELDRLSLWMKEAEYVPNTNLVLHNVED